MTPFQIIQLGFVSLMFVLTASLALRRGARRLSVLWPLLWLLAGLLTIWPDTTTWVARALGIQRGTDLLLYCATLVMLVGFLVVYARLREMRREITVLTRKLALLEAEEADADTAPVVASK